MKDMIVELLSSNLAWKDIIFGAISAAVAILAGFFGGLPQNLLILMIVMTSDYITGLIVAAVFHTSPKTKNGRAESRAGLKGLFRKCAILLVVCLSKLLDILVGTTVVMDAVILWFSLNEILSILENIALMGVEYPPIINDALELLQKKATSIKLPNAVTGASNQEEATGEDDAAVVADDGVDITQVEALEELTDDGQRENQ